MLGFPYLFLYLTDPSPASFSLFVTLTFAISFELSKTVAFDRSSKVKFLSTEIISFNYIYLFIIKCRHCIYSV